MCCSEISENVEAPQEVEAPVEDTTIAYNGDLEYFVSVYSYQSAEPGDLSFNEGETILVTSKNGDWWTGTLGDRSGIFPSNYVQKIGGSSTEESAMTTNDVSFILY